MRLIDTTDVAADAPFILGPLTDTRDVLVQDGLRHAENADHQHCPNAYHMAEGHARLLHLPYCRACFPQGRAA